MNNLRIAVVGCGHWGRNHVRVFRDLGVLAGICDQDDAVAARAAAAAGVPAMQFDDVVTASDIDALVIASPAATHAALTAEAIAHGKHVLVEKPLAISLADARALVDAAETGGVVLMVGHLLRYHPAFIRLAGIVAAGELGAVRYIYSNRLNLGRIRQEENILWSFAPHDISMILALAGEEPASVTSVGATYVTAGVPDVTTTHLTFSHGLHAHVFVSWLHPYKEQKLVVVGERGMAVFDDTKAWEDKLLCYSHSVENVGGEIRLHPAESERVPIEPAEPLVCECAHFLECLTTGATPRTDGREGLRVLKVLDEAGRLIAPAGDGRG